MRRPPFGRSHRSLLPLGCHGNGAFALLHFAFVLQAHERVDEVGAHAYRVKLDATDGVAAAVLGAAAGKGGAIHL